MDYVQCILSLVLSIWKKNSINVCQLLQKILLLVLDELFECYVEDVKDLILVEVNVKEIFYLCDDDEGFLKKWIKLNFKILGKCFGKNMKVVV